MGGGGAAGDGTAGQSDTMGAKVRARKGVWRTKAEGRKHHHHSAHSSWCSLHWNLIPEDQRACLPAGTIQVIPHSHNSMLLKIYVSMWKHARAHTHTETHFYILQKAFEILLLLYKPTYIRILILRGKSTLNAHFSNCHHKVKLSQLCLPLENFAYKTFYLSEQMPSCRSAPSKPLNYSLHSNYAPGKCRNPSHPFHMLKVQCSERQFCNQPKRCHYAVIIWLVIL